MSIQKPSRLIALDALRGFTIAAMVIVNSPGSWNHVYGPLLHAQWNGITATDLVFPFFLFMVGVSITLAYTSKLDDGTPRVEIYKKLFVRSARIMLLGWFLWLWPTFNPEGMRFAGVLPRISLVFLASALIFLNTTWKQQIYLASGILLGYWALLSLVPVPIDGVIQTALETGMVKSSEGQLAIGEIVRLSGNSIAANYEPGVNITAWIDRIILPGSFWQVTWDPEGLISTFPAIVSAVIGLLVGRIILVVDGPFKKITWLFFIGFCLYLAGAMWAWWMPLNKNLWTSSYTLWTAGMATMSLAACILIVDVLGYTKWTKIGRVYGANSISSYVLSGLLMLIFYDAIFTGQSLSNLWMSSLQEMGVNARFASFTYAVLYMLVIYVPALILYRKKIFIKV